MRTSCYPPFLVISSRQTICQLVERLVPAGSGAFEHLARGQPLVAERHLRLALVIFECHGDERLQREIARHSVVRSGDDVAVFVGEQSVQTIRSYGTISR